MRHDQRGHPLVAHSDAEAPAGDARLGDLKDGAANPVSVSDADVAVRHSFDREVFTKLTEFEIRALEEIRPVSIRVELIHHHGTLFAAVSGEIGLTITNEIETTGKHPTLDRAFPDRGPDWLATPGHVARHAHIDRDNPGHKCSSSAATLPS